MTAAEPAAEPRRQHANERHSDEPMMVVWVVVAVVAAISSGWLYQRIGMARCRRVFRPPGEFVDIGGHRVHVQCKGQGAPVVILEAGIAASSLSWSIVLPEVAQFTRACAYDRAGLAWSDAASSSRTFARVVDEFAAVVSHVASDAPRVLVGHSFGTFIVRAYAARYPERVVGLVLVDPPTEWLQMTPQRARLIRGARQLSKVGALLAHLGVVRASLALLSGGAPAAPRRIAKLFGPTAARTLERLVGEVRKLPPSVHPIVQAHWSEPKCFHAMADYLRSLGDEGAVIAATLPPRDVPVTVISSAQQPEPQITAHRALAEAAVDGRHLIARQSGHWIQFDEPEVIVTAIREFVDRARTA